MQLVVGPVLVATSWSSYQSCSSCEAALNQCSALQAVRAVADMVQSHGVMQLVVDPVLVATSGDSLASSKVAAALKQHLFPLATVITPNLPEASALLDGRPVEDLAAMKQVSNRCAVLCCAVLCCAVLCCAVLCCAELC